MALRGRPWRTLFAGGRRTPWINGGLAALLVVAVVLAFTVIGNPSTPAAPVRTAVVTRGDVTATVTGSGNAASQASVPASFATDGTVTAVDVKAGDTVTAGQVLATVDPAASKEGLRTAQAALDGARAAYEQAAAGPTDVKRQQDQQAVTEAQQAVDNARTQLANDTASTATDVTTARVQLSTDTTAQNTAVSQARVNASTACTGVALQAYSVPLAGAATTSTGSTGLDHHADRPTTPTTTRHDPAHDVHLAPTTTAAASTTSATDHLVDEHDARAPPPQRELVHLGEAGAHDRREHPRPDAAEGPAGGHVRRAGPERHPRQGPAGDRDRPGPGPRRAAHRRGGPAPADPGADRPGAVRRRLGPGAGRHRDAHARRHGAEGPDRRRRARRQRQGGRVVRQHVELDRQHVGRRHVSTPARRARRRRRRPRRAAASSPSPTRAGWRSRRTSPRRTPPASSSASRPPSRSRPRTTPRPGPSRRSPRRAR